MVNSKVFFSAFKYSLPVLLGYLAIGTAFGLLMSNTGYSWMLALLMSVVMYAGAGQYIAVGLFASGASLAEAVIVQFVVNARHIAYGITMFKKFNAAGICKPYLIFALTDETFALLSSTSVDASTDVDVSTDESTETSISGGIRERGFFMLYVSVLNQLYWITGTLIGAFAGVFLPFNFEGVSFALSALFIVLMIEQVLRVKKIMPFVISAAIAVIAAVILPARVSLLSSLIAALAVVQFFSPTKPAQRKS
jgi:4-azaleucine resistance transporter AzlC